MTFDDLPTLFSAAPHTLAKHAIYRKYLEAWLPILAQGGYRKLLIVEGFAGPGRYDKGEEGSPLVAVRSVLEHSRLTYILSSGTRIRFLFIEARDDRFEYLKRELRQFQLPVGVEVLTERGTFEDRWGKYVSRVEVRKEAVEPLLVFIDPFGPTGFPMRLVKRVAGFEASEVLINFAYQSLNHWFLSQPKKYPDVDELYGTPDWRDGLKIRDSRQREDFFINKYLESLARPGWDGVAYQMVNTQNQTQYYLVYGTKHHLGMRAFKQAAKAVAPDGQFRFSDLRNPNQLGFLEEINRVADIEELAIELVGQYRGKLAPKRELDVYADFHRIASIPDLRQALLQLENAQPPKILEVIRPDGKVRKPGTFPPDCFIRFAA